MQGCNARKVISEVYTEVYTTRFIDQLTRQFNTFLEKIIECILYPKNIEISIYKGLELLQHIFIQVIMQKKLCQRCKHLFYCSVLSLGVNVNTNVEAWHGINLLHKKSMKYSGHRKLFCEWSKLSKFNALTFSDTKRTLMHLFLFTNSAQRELVSTCTQSIRNCN